MNTLAAIKIVEIGLATAMTTLINAQRYNALIIAAREAGREITDEELAALQAESQASFDALKESLDVTEISTD